MARRIWAPLFYPTPNPSRGNICSARHLCFGPRGHLLVALPNPLSSSKAPSRAPQKKLPTAVATHRPNSAARIMLPFPPLRPLSPAFVSPVVDIAGNRPRNPGATQRVMNPTWTFRSSRRPFGAILHRARPARLPSKMKRASGRPALVVNAASLPIAAIEVAYRPTAPPRTPRAGRKIVKAAGAKNG